MVDDFVQYGVCLARNPRVTEKDNEDFLAMMADYFEEIAQKYYKGDPLTEHVFPQHSYQCGTTPELLERARNHSKKIESWTPENKPMSPLDPVKDHKWRFMWNIGDDESKRGTFHMEGTEIIGTRQVIPPNFPQWEQTMNKFGGNMIDTTYAAAGMISHGLGLKRSLVDMIKGAPHKLSPTGSDLKKKKVGDILAGLHYDLSFLTIHGRSNYPGLFLWLRNGEKFTVSIPKGCLFMQAAKQMEWLTGGVIEAGFHEVIYTEEAHELMKRNVAEGKTHWRVSSTLFTSCKEDLMLEPDVSLRTDENSRKYPLTRVRDHMGRGLKNVELKKEKS